MRALIRICRQTLAVRVLALLLALGVAGAPLLPQPRQHVCPMGGGKSAGMAMAMAMTVAMGSDCCCAAITVQHDHRVPDKGGCCQELALDQHQPTALPGPESSAQRALPTAQLVEVLPRRAGHERGLSVACAAPYPEGPPAYLRWGGFLT